MDSLFSYSYKVMALLCPFSFEGVTSRLPVGDAAGIATDVFETCPFQKKEGVFTRRATVSEAIPQAGTFTARPDSGRQFRPDARGREV